MKESQAKETRCIGPENCGAIKDDGYRYCVASGCLGWKDDTDGVALAWAGVGVMCVVLEGTPRTGFCRYAK